MELSALIHAMSQGEFYPHHPSRVELRQTQRHHFCQEEIRLNRRLAPATYLGVVAIRRDGECFFVGRKLPLGDWRFRLHPLLFFRPRV